VTITAPAPATTRSPLSVRAGAALLVLLAAASTFGVVMFGFVWADDPLGAGTVFVAFAIAAAVTAVASVPRLLRGDRLAWSICLLWGCSYTYWSVYKVFAEEEFESVGFLAAGTGVVCLLLTRSAREHVGVRAGG
jgi:hypothetical protein